MGGWDSGLGTQDSGLRLSEKGMSRKLTYDTWLFAAALLLVVIGLVVIYSVMAIVLGALIAALFSPAINGTHRWIALPHMRFQPSEFAKPVVVLFLASFLSRREEK